MDQEKALIYVSYLGKTKPKRLGAILKLIHTTGTGFFEKYSTPTDTILCFINKLVEKNLL